MNDVGEFEGVEIMNRITPIGPPNPEFENWEISLMLDPDLDKEKALAAKANAGKSYSLITDKYKANWRNAQWHSSYTN